MAAWRPRCAPERAWQPRRPRRAPRSAPADRSTIWPYREGEPEQLYYQRYAHPNGLAAERTLGELEGGEALLFPSGTGAATPARGPIFRGAIHDCVTHIATVRDFWSGVLHGTDRYKGNAFAPHMKLRFEPEAHAFRYIQPDRDGEPVAIRVVREDQIRAAGERLGWVDREAAKTMLIVLPLVAFIMIRRSGRCALTARDA